MMWKGILDFRTAIESSAADRVAPGCGELTIRMRSFFLKITCSACFSSDLKLEVLRAFLLISVQRNSLGVIKLSQE